jgi:hypothetical protein
MAANVSIKRKGESGKVKNLLVTHLQKNPERQKYPACEYPLRDYATTHQPSLT